VRASLMRYPQRFILSSMCLLLSSLAHAIDATPNRIEALVDGYYPTYPATTPAPGFTEAQVKRGEYLAKMGDCISCHTDVKAKTPVYSGQLAIKTPFGTLFSPNITPDKETGIGAWTEQDFIRALKEGRSPHGKNYIPAFPYVAFSNITDDDVRALYAYFMSIPPVSLKNKPPLFPFNMPGVSAGLWGWKLLFFFPETPYQYDPAQSPEWNRGKYIVDGLGHCSMCHTPMNPLGGLKQKYYLTGSFIDGYWAPNITHYGLKSAKTYQVADVFSKGVLLHEAGPVAGPMAEVNHNSLSYMTEKDRLAIATYLKTVVSDEPLGLKASDAKPSLKRGRQVYINTCIICHQNGIMSAPLLGNSANWYRRLKNSGLTGLYEHTIHGYNSMPIKGACVTCSNNDVISAVDYMLHKSLTRSQELDLKSGGAKKFPTSGQTIYNENCATCHAEGKLGAPIVGDKSAWKPLIEKNIDVLIQKTMHGTHHPKRGGCEQCSTREVIDAIKYMVGQSQEEGNYSLW